MKTALALLLAWLTLPIMAQDDSGATRKRDAGQMNPAKLAMAGQRLDAGQASDLESVVAAHPDDLSARTKLLGYYFMRQYSSPEATRAREGHILWIIKNRPEAPIAGLPFCTLDAITDGPGYNTARELWLQQTKAQADNTAILGNAANFFVLSDRDMAEQLLQQAEKLEPNKPQWPDALGHLYALAKIGGDATAGKSLAEFEKAQSADQNEASRFHRLEELAKSAFAAGDLEKAAHYASELLIAGPNHGKDWDRGNAIHVGNTVLGRIALKHGDNGKAGEYLLKSGQTPGSPVLDSFGPNMSLAKELLEKGQRDTVLQYFDLCRKFWRSGATQLDEWTRAVKAGESPDFGGNLDY